MSSVERNLILAFNSEFMPGNDFEVIADKIRQRAPDIEVFVISSVNTSFKIRRRAQTRPTLVFSQGPLLAFEPRRGKIYCGQSLSKIDQLTRLAACNVPVPDWTVLKEGTVLNPEQWGEMVAIKPTGSSGASQGRGIQYLKTENVEYIPPEDYPKNHVGRFGPMIAQKFIDSGEYPREHRVLCLFGTPLYSVVFTSSEPRPPARKKYDLHDPRDLVTSNKVKKFGLGPGSGSTEFVTDPDLLKTAGMTYEAIPNAPLHGVDLVQDQKTGKYYVMEPNPLGFTWHFSSFFAGQRHPEFHGMRREEQFDAFSLAADVLIERTRKEAE